MEEGGKRKKRKEAKQQDGMEESGLIPWFGKKTEQMAGTVIQP